MVKKYGNIFTHQRELHQYNINLLKKKNWHYSEKNNNFDNFKKGKQIMKGFPYASSSKLRIKLLLENTIFNTDFIYFTKKNYLEVINEQSHIFKYDLLFLKKSNGSQGKHVFPIRNKNDVIKIMENKYHKYHENTNFILEKGISKPLLFKEKKFDLRVYLLFVRKDDTYYSYLFPQWFLRTSNTVYNADSLKKKNMLTNTSVNGKKANNQFVFQKISNINGENMNTLNKNLYNCLFYFSKKWKEYLKDANFRYFNKELTNGLQFNLFGIDIIFDEKLNPYILEINYNPLFAASKSIKDIRILKRKMWKYIIYDFINSYSETSTLKTNHFIDLNNEKMSINDFDKLAETCNQNIINDDEDIDIDDNSYISNDENDNDYDSDDNTNDEKHMIQNIKSFLGLS
jgi:hypothetical protein